MKGIVQFRTAFHLFVAAANWSPRVHCWRQIHRGRSHGIYWFAVALAGFAFGASLLPAESRPGAGAPASLIETGVPAFVVLGPEALGLSSPPTDLHLLHDGRVMLFARNEIAIGDGQRWEVVRKAKLGGDEMDNGTDMRSVAVDDDGTIYVGIRGGFARIDFGEDGFWRLRRVAPYPATSGPVFPVLTEVAMTDAGWFWHSLSGMIVRWHPGDTPHVVDSTNSVDSVFPALGGTYLTNTLTGSLDFLGSAGKALEKAEAIMPMPRSITCSAPFDAKHALLGTSADGLKIFDGKSLQPLVNHGPLSGEQWINDLCETEPGLYAAVLQTIGLVFFDRTGRIIQVLDRSTDPRLGRAKHLAYSGGVVWVLLHDGIARVQFPASVSTLEWLVPTALAHEKPVRFEGRLWLVTNGRAERGVYNEDGRLVGFEDDSPPGRYVGTLSVGTGALLATNEEGIFLRENGAWRLVVSGVANARIEAPDPDPNRRRWAYFARGEYGWLTRTGNNFSVQRAPNPSFDHDVYLSVTDARGDIWLEMGAGKFGRARLGEPFPTLEIFDHILEKSDTWVNIFVVEGTARFNVNAKIFRLDEATRRLVLDRDLIARIPDIAVAVGRPATDARGRLWMTTHGAVKVLDLRSDDPTRNVERIPSHLQPNGFAMEDNGVVWLLDAQLARFDPSIPAALPPPIRALITRVTLTARNRTIFSPSATLPPLEFEDNAISVKFAATGGGVGQAIIFDVKLEGGDGDWTSTGAGGSEVFNHLKEGAYTLRVRPRSASQIGAEATLAFTVLPPWYRTTLAYIAAGFTAVGLVFAAAWMLSYLQRRDRARLERLVTERTLALNETNRRLEQQVTETSRKASELQVSEERLLWRTAFFEAQVDSALDGILVVDNAGRKILQNERMSELWKFPREIVENKDDSAQVRYATDQTKNPQEFAEKIAYLYAHPNDVSRDEVELVDGTLFDRYSSPVRDKAGKLYGRIWTFRDITAGRRLEEQFRQVQKMDAVGRLAAGIAHDFNNLIAVVQMQSSLLLGAPADETETREGIQQIMAAAERAASLTRQLLTFSRQSVREAKDFDLCAVVDNIAKLIRRLLGEDIAMETHFSPMLPLINGDAGMMEQVLMNLAVNARDAMPKGGRLIISLSVAVIDNTYVAAQPRARVGRFVRLSVSDSGYGIVPENLTRIFEPFFTTKEVGKGTGLGLATVFGIVEQHHGWVEVMSAVDQGSTFQVYIPALESSAATGVAVSSPLAVRGGNERILLVEDDPVVRKLARAVLDRQGYQVVDAECAASAIQRWEENHARFDLLFTDLIMPGGMTGGQLAEELTKRQPNLKVVFTSGYSNEIIHRQLKLDASRNFVAKPCSAFELAAAIRRCLDES
jgi:signal transduction histidine kinase/CheY-like chemotaxis protein